MVSQTPLAQTSRPADGVQVPFSVGLWPGSLGTGEPLGSGAVQTCVASSHHWPPVQSPSTLHPPEGSQVPFELHAPERQTLPERHGPSPSA